MKNMIAPVFALCLFLVGCSPAAFGQQDQREDVDALIRHQDSLFWKAYNQCDVPGMMQFFTDDVEFYHDMGGATIGKAAMSANTARNLCGKADFRLRREEVRGTVKVFPMYQNKAVYGAIISGEHVFYINDGGKPEYLDGHARFSQLWVLRNGAWKMSRVLSYDHGPAVNKNRQKAGILTPVKEAVALQKK